MRIDFKQLAKIEKQYAMNNQRVSLNTLQTMVDQVLAHNPLDVTNTSQIHISLETLKELGILKDDTKSNVELLKS